MAAIERILDANANRAREALRVMEDAARFLLDDASLAGDAKRLRHALAGALGAFPSLAWHRNTPGDVGTTLRTDAEMTRRAPRDVAIAAARRATEALRTLEEYAKIIDPDAAATIERLRYDTYEIERRLTVALGSPARGQWRLCVLVTEALCRRPWTDVVRAAVDAGADAVQLREKSMPDARLLDRARALVDLVAGRAHVIVNDRPDIAVAAGADGVHLGQADLSCTDVRRLFGPRLLVGVSTSRLEDATAAARAGADVCGVGPMFATTTKHKDVIVGPSYLRDYLAHCAVPHLAIGGITPETLPRLVDVGVRGIAVSHAVCAAADPGAVVARLLGLMGPSAAAP